MFSLVRLSHFCTHIHLTSAPNLVILLIWLFIRIRKARKAAAMARAKGAETLPMTQADLSPMSHNNLGSSTAIPVSQGGYNLPAPSLPPLKEPSMAPVYQFQYQYVLLLAPAPAAHVTVHFPPFALVDLFMMHHRLVVQG